MSKKKRDNVNHPKHYNVGKIEVIEFIDQVTKTYPVRVAYYIGNVIKYVARAPFKNGVEDLKKAKWYLNRAIKKLNKDKSNVGIEVSSYKKIAFQEVKHHGKS